MATERPPCNPGRRNHSWKTVAHTGSGYGKQGTIETIRNECVHCGTQHEKRWVSGQYGTEVETEYLAPLAC